MIKKYIIYFISSILLVLVFLNFLFYKEFNNVKEELLKKSDKIESLQSRVLMQSHYSGHSRFPNDYSLQSIDGELNFSSDIFSSPTVVLYISSFHCNTCIDDSIDKIENLFVKNSEMKYIIISKGFSLREMKLMKKDRHIKAPVYLMINDLPFFNKMDKSSFPYYFTININLEISNVFFPIKSSSILEKRYFERIKAKQ